MRAVWLTDIHFEHLEPKQINQFLAEIAAEQPDATLVCGDIAWADQIRDRLELMAEIIAQPIYFVLGNHDYYGGSISDVRFLMKGLSERRPATFSGGFWLKTESERSRC
jgi:predicted MPP superfamily phosphohydrolase